MRFGKEMPRPKNPAADTEPKKRSRTGCWPCKARKVKCDETRPTCANCQKHGETCDYSIRLNWGGRSKTQAGVFTFVAAPTPASTAPQSNGGGGSGSGAGGAGGAGAAGGVVGGGGPGQRVFSAQHIATTPARPMSSHPTSEPVGTSEHTLVVDSRRQQSQQHIPPQSSSARDDDFHWSPQHHAKRVKRSSPSAAGNQHNDRSPASYYTPPSWSSAVHTPATPGSSVQSTSPHPSHSSTLHVQDPPDLRRLSVKSLLSDPTDQRPSFVRNESTGYRTYGYDHGLPDHDVPHNDDHNVVLPRSPDMRRPSAAVSENSTSSAEDARQIAFEPGGYYAQPVAVKLPRALEPLPDELLHNPMNLLYFHHFLNHTGRVMVPHDCPENPFRVVLPVMAVRNTQLLHLLLAFSASHRARLLGHDEPANRIAGWMADVLPALRQALDEPGSPGVRDPSDPSSLAPLATAIMFASLEIITPHSFSIRIPWQQHLQMARRLIIAKGGLHHLAQQADGARDKATFFLSRWFAYLDVLGSLSNRHEQPLFGAYMEDGGGLWLVNRDNEEIYQIDCFFGFSGRCIALLAQVAELSAQCDNQRIDPVTNQIKTAWRPTAEIRQQAEELKQRLGASAGMVFRGCMHTHPGSPESSSSSSHIHNANNDDSDAAEIYATNEAYHWAGRIHLARRVCALQSSDPEVQECVQNVLDLLQKIRRGSSAESCLLFPMFTAGCEAQREEQREAFMRRMEAVEGWGMSHVGKARRLMQMVWDTGKGWETLVDGEFLG